MFGWVSLWSQNLVRNPNFTEIDTCPNEYGQIRFARSWQSYNEHSPDLFDSCSTSRFYNLPTAVGCNQQITAPKDNGLVGIAMLANPTTQLEINEGITSWLNPFPDKKSDIYCSLQVTTMPKCGTPEMPSNFCYFNGLGMAIEYKDGSKQIVLEAKDVIKNTGDWLTLHSCYKPIGDEQKLTIRNFQSYDSAAKECEVINKTQNYGYVYLDNIVVAPFDILPDRLVVCSKDSLYFDGLDFYDLPLSWEDNVQGSARYFDKSGRYTLRALAGDCILRESLQVYVIDSTKDINLDTVFCKSKFIDLNIDIPGKILWDNQDTIKIRQVNSPGKYSASVQTTCANTNIVFEVNEIDCSKNILVANIFSPNNDGVNDEIFFNIDPKVRSVNGNIFIYDRWGNLVFMTPITTQAIWDGKSTNRQGMTPGVYTWMYVDSDNGGHQVGNVTIL